MGSSKLAFLGSRVKDVDCVETLDGGRDGSLSDITGGDGAASTISSSSCDARCNQNVILSEQSGADCIQYENKEKIKRCNLSL